MNFQKLTRMMNKRMTFNEFLEAEQKRHSPRKHSNEEHKLQCACVRWFRLQYPLLANALFAIPNGGSRNKIEANNMKQEGVTAGVADLILLMRNANYGALCIEMKTLKGIQSETQKKWQHLTESLGNKYVICRSFEEFTKIITDYMKNI